MKALHAKKEQNNFDWLFSYVLYDSPAGLDQKPNRISWLRDV